MKKLFILLLWLTTALNSYAQEAVNQPLLDYFQNMDMNQVNTGILKERGFPVFDMDFFNGQTLTDTNRLDVNRFGWIYMQLMLGNVNDNSNLPDPQVYMNQYINDYTGTGNIPIAIANYRYNYIKSTAIDQNLVYVNNGKMYDTPNRTNSPYGEATLFAATTLALRSNKANTSFSVPSNLYLTNQTATLQTLQVDLDDGQGYRTISLGQNFSTQYSSNGVKTIKIKATLIDGNGAFVLISHTSLELNDPSLISTPDSPPISYNELPTKM